MRASVVDFPTDRPASAPEGLVVPAKETVSQLRRGGRRDYVGGGAGQLVEGDEIAGKDDEAELHMGPVLAAHRQSPQISVLLAVCQTPLHLLLPFSVDLLCLCRCHPLLVPLHLLLVLISHHHSPALR